MSYIGRGIDQIDNISTLDNLSFNGSSTTFNLTQNSVAFVPVSADALQIQIDGIIQSGNFSVSGSTVTFNFTPSGSSVCNGIKHFGVGVAFTPSSGSVTKDKTNFVSTSSSPGLEIKGDGTTDGTLQLNCSQNSHGIKLKSPPHSAGASYTLTFPNDDGTSGQALTTNGSGVLTWADAGGANTPNFSATRNSDQTGVSDNTETKIQFNNVQYDTASGWDSSNYWWVVPSGQGGKYYISWSAYCSGGGYAFIDSVNLLLYGGGGTNAIDVVSHSSHNSNFDLGIFKGSGIYSLSVGDKINVYASINVDGGTARIDGSGTWDYTHLQLFKIIE
jgi:hypothetical protein